MCRLSVQLREIQNFRSGGGGGDKISQQHEMYLEVVNVFGFFWMYFSARKGFPLRIVSSKVMQCICSPSQNTQASCREASSRNGSINKQYLL